ncbi:MAG: fimbrillin family protein [Prevotellaceae bacterium]|jgi:hypothetical protein|nr:fimbrillin family protein [Prevotellaceae bacterium]
MKMFLRPLSTAAIAAVTLLTAASCSQTTILPTENAGKAIRFQPVTERTVDTKASITTLATMEDFRVVASAVGEEKFNDIANYLFDRVIVSKDDDGTWGYNPIVLWPADATEGYFFAWSPARSPYAAFASHPASGTAQYSPYARPMLYYQIPADITPAGVQQQEDLLVAQSGSITSNRTVKLQFQHALSRVVFRARSEVPGMNFYVKDVQLCNVYAEGYLYMNDSQISTHGPLNYTAIYGDDYLCNMWDIGFSARQDYKVSLPGGAVYVPYNATTPTAFTDLHASTNALMMIPQDGVDCYLTKITESAVKPTDDKYLVKLTYNAAGSPSADKTVYLNVCKPGTLDEAFVFEMGRQYNFNISITDSGVQYTVALSDWDVAAPEVPVPATMPYAVGDQFDQLGYRGVVAAITEDGAATSIYQIVPLPKNPGTLNFTSTSRWSLLNAVYWNVEWNKFASTEEQKEFADIWKTTKVEYKPKNKQGIIELMAELKYEGVISDEFRLEKAEKGVTPPPDEWLRRALHDTQWQKSDYLSIIANTSDSYTLTSVELKHPTLELHEIGILKQTTLPYPVYK